jgi:hypothetical protein
MVPDAYFVPRLLAKAGHHPPVGVYIGIMGGLAAAVSLRTKPRFGEITVWIVVITLLMIAEIQNLYRADAEQTAKFGAISTGLDATSKGLDATAVGLSSTSNRLDSASANNQKQFKSTMSEFSATTTRLGAIAKSQEDMVGIAKETLAQTVGGRGYIWVVRVPPTSSIYPTTDAGSGKWALMIENSERTPLLSVGLEIQQCDVVGDSEEVMNKHFRERMTVDLPLVRTSEQGSFFIYRPVTQSGLLYDNRKK